ncbi:glycoside hydrolase [Candidatus Saganbacteria bacterium]|nr:glycoside hydrolase [Candidatus Saganbacteria bacterium]
MTHQPIYLALVWHMHQPYYKDLVTNEYILPWVRLHGIKDYYDMAALLDDYPNMKATFNMVPSLVLQIDDYVNNNAKDRSLLLSEKDPMHLTDEEKVYILKNFFMANWDVMIKPYKNYHDLLLKRGRFAPNFELEKVANRFTKQEFMDLQVWFNLTWFGFNYRNHDPIVSALIAKGKGFTREEKLALLNKQIELLGKIIPKCRELQDRSQIEVTTSPFYHPILPLVCDTNVAHESMPYVKLPSVRFRHPEDAESQIQEAVKFHEQHFGKPPFGMWPSEGSVSEEMIPLVGKAGIKWIATDESILSSSLSKSPSASELYKPYHVEKDGNQVSMIFRNHFLSDQIGFVYQRWRVKEAVADFKKHLYNIRAALPDDGRKYLVSVILDGENAWEYYRDGGEEFLRGLYQGLSSDQSIIPTRVCDFIAENQVDSKIHRLFPASWINNNFKIWIGHEEDNLAWDYLSRARAALEGQENQLAWQELYVAEGSDWNWWYGDDHSSENDEVFDALFRKHLKNIYHLLGNTVPQYLDKPIKQLRALKPTREPAFYIEPALDGVVTNYYEWLSAGCFDIESSKGAMHQIETVIKALYYGFNKSTLFFRLDCALDLSTGGGSASGGQKNECQGFSFSILIYHPVEYRLKLNCGEKDCGPKLTLYKMNENEVWEKIKEMDSFGMNKIIEVGVSFSDIEAKAGDMVQFSVIIEKNGNELERWPRGGMLSVNVPTPSYEMEQWSI